MSMVVSLEMLNFLRGQQGLPPVIAEVPVYPAKLEEIKADLLERFNIDAHYVFQGEDGYDLEWCACSEEYCEGWNCYTSINLTESDEELYIEQKNNGRWTIHEEFESFAEFDEFWKTFDPTWKHIEED